MGCGEMAWQSKQPRFWIEPGLFGETSLTITYFHTGCSTIIGATSFHGPVRDGKGWGQRAMVIRHNWYGCRQRCLLAVAAT